MNNKVQEEPISLSININRKELIKALQMFPRNYIELVIYRDHTLQLTDDTKFLKIKGYN